jgi:thiosulfate dehydrogenase [quinone] large subunit
MNIVENRSSQFTQFVSRRIAAVRILFGLVWAVDAAFKFEPAFYNGILQSIKSADSGEPSWLNHWFNVWYRIIGSNPHLFAVIILIIETLIAISLLFGIARRINYSLGALLSFLVWSVAEGFGGPYVSGSTDIGAGFIYVIVFLLLYVADSSVSPSWSLDPFIEKHVSWWHFVASAPQKIQPSDNSPALKPPRDHHTYAKNTQS